MLFSGLHDVGRECPLGVTHAYGFDRPWVIVSEANRR